MDAYYREVRQLEDKFDGLELNHIPRHLNEVADMLVRYKEPEQASNSPHALGSGANQPSALSDPKVMELVKDPAVEPDPLADWRMPYLDYLLCEALPMDKTKAQWLARCAKSFVVIEGELYK